MQAREPDRQEDEEIDDIVQDVAGLLQQRAGSLNIQEFSLSEQEKVSPVNRTMQIRKMNNDDPPIPQRSYSQALRPKPTIYTPYLDEVQEYAAEMKGIQNKRGENNCFINVVIQSLWHLGSFRHRFLEDEPHVHNNELEELEVKERVLKMRASVSTVERMLSNNGVQRSHFTHDFTSQLSLRSKRKKELGDDWLDQDQDEEGVVVKNKAQEQCLHCNLREMFQDYQNLSRKGLLQPKKVRQSLERLGGAARGFQRGEQGQPQQVFEDILSYIHRDSIFPKFMEELLTKGRQTDNFELLDSFDNYPCNPECPAHRCFGFQLCDQAFCLKCKMTHPETLQNVTVQSYIRLYVSEFKQFLMLMEREKPDKQHGLQTILLYHFKNNMSAMRRRKFKYQCSCKGAAAAFQKWCISVPTIIAITLQWAPEIALGNDPKQAKQQMRTVLKLIQPIIDIRTFLNVGVQGAEGVNKYVLRGFISYYGHHYTAYFYSEGIDRWVKFDDDVIKEVGNYSDVQERILKGRELIVQLFYESQIYTEKIIRMRYERMAQKVKEAAGVSSVAGPEHTYFSMQGRKSNYFWKGGQAGDSSKSNCSVF